MSATPVILTPPRVESLQRRRFKARAWYWVNGSPNVRLRNCGLAPVNSAAAVHDFRYPDGSHRYVGTQHCNMVWSCPVCSAQILAVRARLLAKVLESWRKTGGHVAMVTLTLSHGKKDKLADLWDMSTKAWKKASSGPYWGGAAANFGTVMTGRAGVVKKRLPLIRSTEITWGKNGWHPHIHALLFLPPSSVEVADASLIEIFGGMVERWTREVQNLGGKSLAKVQEAHILKGRDFDEQAGQYLAKQVLGGVGSVESAAQEIMRADMKTARLETSLTPFQMLEALADGSESTELKERWLEFVKTSHGRRQMSVTPGLLKHLGFDSDTFTSETKAHDQSDPRDDEWQPVRRHSIMSETASRPPSCG